MKSLSVIQFESNENLYRCCDILALHVMHRPPIYLTNCLNVYNLFSEQQAIKGEPILHQCSYLFQRFPIFCMGVFRTLSKIYNEAFLRK